MSKNIYEQIQENGYSSLGTDIAIMEICLQTMIKIGRITEEARVEFLSSIHAGDVYDSALEKFKKL
jgi:hypothetical protein